MNIKNFISRCELLQHLKALQNGPHTPEEGQQLASALEHFARQITHITREEGSRVDLLRLFAYLRAVFVHLKSTHELPPEQGYFLEAALRCLHTERNLVMLQIRYPALSEPNDDKKKSPLMWSAAFTPTDLMELISALHAAGAIRKADGSPLSLRTLIRAFESFLNVSIKNPERCRQATINRSLHLTKFLDMLRDALLELSSR